MTWSTGTIWTSEDRLTQTDVRSWRAVCLRLDATLIASKKARNCCRSVSGSKIKGGIRGIPMLWGWTRASCISYGCWLRVDGYSGARGCSSPPHLHARCWGGWGLAYYATCCGQVLHGNECAPRTQCVSNIRGRHGFQWLWDRPPTPTPTIPGKSQERTCPARPRLKNNLAMFVKVLAWRFTPLQCCSSCSTPKAPGFFWDVTVANGASVHGDVRSLAGARGWMGVSGWGRCAGAGCCRFCTSPNTLFPLCLSLWPSQPCCSCAAVFSLLLFPLRVDHQEALLVSMRCWTWPAPPWLLPTRQRNVEPIFWVRVHVFMTDTFDELFFQFRQLLLHFIQNVLNKKRST